MQLVHLPLTEQKLSGKLRVIKTSFYLSKLEIKEIKRNIYNSQEKQAPTYNI